MIRVEYPANQADKLLIGSDLPTATAARFELSEWSKRNGYRQARDARSLSVYEQGTLVREWMLVERRAERKPLFPFNPLASRSKSDRASERLA